MLNPSSTPESTNENEKETSFYSSARKKTIYNSAERYALNYDQWQSKRAYFQEEDSRYLRFLIPENLRILDLGCGFGDKLAALKPRLGVGIDFSPTTLKRAKEQYPDLNFIEGDIENENFLTDLFKQRPELFKEPFDVILLSDTIGLLDDCQKTLSYLHLVSNKNTRIVVSYYSRLWDPIIQLAELFGQKFPQPDNNFLSTLDISNLLNLAGFKTIKREWRQLCPKKLWGVGPLINRYLATLPGIRRFCLRNYIIARPNPSNTTVRSPALNVFVASSSQPTLPSTSVIITCRNEKGNVEPAIQRLSQFCPDMEIIFAEGHSRDGTLDEIHRVIQAYPERNIKVYVQTGVGKGDAVRLGFEKATKDILMILDGDLTMPPEDLPKFYDALVQGQGEFINGTRLIYPMENDAMQFLNYLANTVFSWLFTYLLNQRFTDTLCGTKVLFRKQYQQIADNRHYFGEFDPFGDFDLIFGASKLNLDVVEIPIRYKARTYGSTQISRFRHGWLLLQMVLFAYRKLKAF